MQETKRRDVGSMKLRKNSVILARYFCSFEQITLKCFRGRGAWQIEGSRKRKGWFCGVPVGARGMGGWVLYRRAWEGARGLPRRAAWQPLAGLGAGVDIKKKAAVVYYEWRAWREEGFIDV